MGWLNGSCIKSVYILLFDWSFISLLEFHFSIGVSFLYWSFIFKWSPTCILFG